MYYVVSDSNMTSYNENLAAPRQLSLVLYELLNKLGLSKEIRKLHREHAYTTEISHNLIFSDLCRWYIFGSAIEGTQTPGMKSDIDMAIVDQAIEVFTNCSSSGGKPGYIVVQDETTPPGHVKLQVVNDNKPLQGTCGLGGIILDECRSQPSSEYHLLPDDKGRIVITEKPGYIPPIPNVTKHGVAFKMDNKGEVADIDIVLALQSKVLPDCVTDCLMRKRNSAFLTASVVEACKSYGCLFVRKEHCQSIDSRLLWRISPSHQERLLMFNFNSVQHKCYGLLKLIKKDIINPALGSEVLTSYHCKTAMLHLIDMTPSQFWRPDNLLFCLITALHCLLLWSMDSNCPNFFIPDENMFRWRISRHLLKRLSDELFRLMSLDFLSLLRSIKTDSLNYRIQIYMLGNCQHLTTPYDYRPLLKLSLNNRIFANIMLMRYYLVLKCYSNSTNDLVDNLYSQRSILMHTDGLDIHTPVHDTQRTIAMLVPYIEIYLMSNIVALSVMRGDARETTWGYLTNVRWQEISHSSDPFTSKLKQAGLMSGLGHHRASLNVLSTIENKESLKGCFCHPEAVQFSEQEKRLLVRLSADEILHQSLAPCVLFLPTEKYVVPSALCYEMSITEAPADIHSWHDHWAIVDGKFLLHFLLYLNRKNLGLSFEADIQEMEQYFKNDRREIHKYTHLNLLGWVYKEEGKLDIAYECFKKSLHFRPQQKAAIWHILCLISSIRLSRQSVAE